VGAERDGAHLPVPDVPRHEQETAAAAAHAVEHARVLGERRDAGHERFAAQLPDVDRVTAVLEELAARQLLGFRLRHAEGRAKVVADAGLRPGEERHGEAVAHEIDRVQHRHGKPARAVVEAPVDHAVGEPVADPLFPSARWDEAARSAVGRRFAHGKRRVYNPLAS
jgi:hypothetical protein